MWSTSAWRSSCKSHTPLRDRLWTPVCPNHGRGRVPAPPGGFEPDLGRCYPSLERGLSPSWALYGGRKEKQDKGRGRRRLLRPVTTARSAGSYGSFPGDRKWGQNPSSDITPAVTIPEQLLPQQKNRGHAPERSSLWAKKRDSPSISPQRRKPFWSAGFRRMEAGA